MNNIVLARTLGFLLALFCMHIPLPDVIEPMRPQCILLVTIYWVLVLDRRCSLLEILCWGLINDVATNSPLGLNALFLLFISAITAMLAPRLRNTSVFQQGGFILLSALFYATYTVFIHLLLGETLLSISFWAMPVITALIWLLIGGPLLIRRIQNNAHYNG